MTDTGGHGRVLLEENAEEFGIPYNSRHGRASIGGDGRRPPAQLARVGRSRAGVGPTPWGRPERPHLGHRGPGAGPAAGGHRPAGPRALRRDRGRDKESRAANADDVATVIRALAPGPGGGRHVHGRHDRLGASDRRATSCRGWCWWTSPPGSTKRRRRPSPISSEDRRALPTSTPSWQARTVEHNPTRSVASLRRGYCPQHAEQEDGSWVWRYTRHRTCNSATRCHHLFGPLGGGFPRERGPWHAAPWVVDDTDEAEFGPVGARVPGSSTSTPATVPGRCACRAGRLDLGLRRIMFPTTMDRRPGRWQLSHEQDELPRSGPAY